MNFSPPQWIKDAANEALGTVVANHYSHPKGRIRLRNAIKAYFGDQFGRDLDVESEILVTSGANEGKSHIRQSAMISLILLAPGEYSVLTAFLEPGDEVIMFEPFFDQYLATVVFNGGIPVYVPLHPDRTKDHPTGDDWKIDFDELRYAHHDMLFPLHPP